MNEQKLAILTEAAKYDASCSSSGSQQPAIAGGLGSTVAAGICHSWSADGRCIALLKVLLTNSCAWNCAYCVNRRSNDLPRASFEPEELIRLIMEFYRRNYIEGALLSSGVAGCPDRTMERLIHVARTLRQREGFRGYLHIKIIPGSNPDLVLEAGRWSDRASVNIELPSSASLARVAPDKLPEAIFGPMRVLARASGFEPKRLLAGPPGGGPAELPDSSTRQPAQLQATLPHTSPPAVAPANQPTQANTPAQPAVPVELPSLNPASVRAARQNRQRNPAAAVLPAGQTTQMVIGASPESDYSILNLAENLYLAYDVRRVYYSAYVPTGASAADIWLPEQLAPSPEHHSNPSNPATAASHCIPVACPPDSKLPAQTAGAPDSTVARTMAALNQANLLREHRLYQADWLFRFYGFNADEILSPEQPFLDPRLDPKCAWALRNLQLFPVDINKADYHQLLRVPGIGPRSAQKIVQARRHAAIQPDNLRRLGIQLKRAKFFITCSGRQLLPRQLLDNDQTLRLCLLQDEPAGRNPAGGGAGGNNQSLQAEFAWN